MSVWPPLPFPVLTPQHPCPPTLHREGALERLGGWGGRGGPAPCRFCPYGCVEIREGYSNNPWQSDQWECWQAGEERTSPSSANTRHFMAKACAAVPLLHCSRTATWGRSSAPHRFSAEPLCLSTFRIGWADPTHRALRGGDVVGSTPGGNRSCPENNGKMGGESGVHRAFPFLLTTAKAAAVWISQSIYSVLCRWASGWLPLK